MSSTTSQAIQDIGALLMVVLAMGVVGWLAYGGNETATGALISVISAGTGFYLRGRVESPASNNSTSGTGTGQVVTVSSGPPTVSVGPPVVPADPATVVAEVVLKSPGV